MDKTTAEASLVELQWFCDYRENFADLKNELNPDFPKAVVDHDLAPWQPPYDFYDGKDNLWERYRNHEYMFLYSVCLYYSVLVIGGNELGPRELGELIFMVVSNLVGAIFQAYIFGELAVLITQVDRQGTIEQGMIDNANTVMKNVSLPKDIRAEIREFLKMVSSTMSRQKDLDQFIKQISPSLGNKVQAHMFDKVLKMNNIIKETKEGIEKMEKAINGESEGKRSVLTKKMSTRSDYLLVTIVDKLKTSLITPD